MTRTEALTLALEALGKWSIGFHVDAVELNDLIATLEAALKQPEQPYAEQARRVEQETHGRMRIDPVTGNVSIGTPTEQPEQKPVAWIHRKHYLLGHAENMPPADKALAQGWTPLYTHPPRREWRGLTDEESKDLWISAVKEGRPPRWFAIAIEAALKEKNHE